MTRAPVSGGAVEATQVPAPPAPRAPGEPAPAGIAQAATARPAVPSRSAAGHAADPALAGPWRRLVAFAIDVAILTLVTGALWGRLLASFANRMSNAFDANSRHAPAAHGAYGRVFSNTTGPYLAVLVPTIILAIA